MNNHETDRLPVILSYARPSGGLEDWAFGAGSLILAATFAVTFWIVETATSNLLLFHTNLFPYRDPEKHQFMNLIIEFGMSIPATFLVFLILLMPGPREGWRLSWPVFAAVTGGAIVYSWARWALDLLGWKVSGCEDFLVAMLLAVLITGGVTAILRSQTQDGRLHARSGAARDAD